MGFFDFLGKDEEDENEIFSVEDMEAKEGFSDSPELDELALASAEIDTPAPTAVPEDFGKHGDYKNLYDQKVSDAKRDRWFDIGGDALKVAAGTNRAKGGVKHGKDYSSAVNKAKDQQIGQAYATGKQKRSDEQRSRKEGFEDVDRENAAKLLKRKQGFEDTDRGNQETSRLRNIGRQDIQDGRNTTNFDNSQADRDRNIGRQETSDERSQTKFDNSQSDRGDRDLLRDKKSDQKSADENLYRDAVMKKNPDIDPQLLEGVSADAMKSLYLQTKANKGRSHWKSTVIKSDKYPGGEVWIYDASSPNPYDTKISLGEPSRVGGTYEDAHGVVRHKSSGAPVAGQVDTESGPTPKDISRGYKDQEKESGQIATEKGKTRVSIADIKAKQATWEKKHNRYSKLYSNINESEWTGSLKGPIATKLKGLGITVHPDATDLMTNLEMDLKQYVYEISGAQASQEEVVFIRGMLGGIRDNPDTFDIKMNTFRERIADDVFRQESKLGHLQGKGSTPSGDPELDALVKQYQAKYPDKSEDELRRAIQKGR